MFPTSFYFETCQVTLLCSVTHFSTKSHTYNNIDNLRVEFLHGVHYIETTGQVCFYIETIFLDH